MKATQMRHLGTFGSAVLLTLLLAAQSGPTALAQTPASGETGQRIAQQTQNEDYLPPWQRGNGGGAAEEPGAPQRISPPSGGNSAIAAPAPDNYDSRYDDAASADRGDLPPPRDYTEPPAQAYDRPVYDDNEGYSSNEIVGAGHRFFGGVSKGLADVVEHAFARQGRPNGYILGEDAGGAFVAGLRYGEGTLYTKNAGVHRIYWQGPSIGYDFGAEGSKTMILVYNLRDVDQIYHRFASVDGSAYLVGGVGVTFQTYDDIVLAPIRSGVGLRLGANIGYLKYTRTPTWNPF
jgi:hypothetical protein